MISCLGNSYQLISKRNVYEMRTALTFERELVRFNCALVNYGHSPVVRRSVDRLVRWPRDRSLESERLVDADRQRDRNRQRQQQLLRLENLLHRVNFALNYLILSSNYLGHERALDQLLDQSLLLVVTGLGRRHQRRHQQHDQCERQPHTHVEQYDCVTRISRN